jgi:hypothetical protein
MMATDSALSSRKAKRGRPRKSLEARAAMRTLHITVSVTHYDALCQLAQRHGLPVTHTARQVLLGALKSTEHEEEKNG